jgi:hypothetical protein
MKETHMSTTTYDRDMADFMINQINSCFTQAEDFIYEVMSGTKKLLLDVHGSLIPYERNAYDLSNQPYLYRLLPQAKIALVAPFSLFFFRSTTRFLIVLFCLS